MASSATPFAQCWDRQARERGERLALSDRRRALNWREAADLSRRLARGLLAQGEIGSVVACWLPNWVELYLLRIACERAGLIWLPIAASLREWELQNILERARPAVLIVPEWFRDRDCAGDARSVLAKLSIPPPQLVVSGGPRPAGGISLDELIRQGSGPQSKALPERPADDPLVILPTSGGTGLPKFAEFRISAWFRRAEAQAELLELRAEDVVLALSQGIGPSIIPLFAAPLVGAAVCLVDESDPRVVLEQLARVRPTIVCGVPPQVTALLEHPSWSAAGVDRVRLWYTTGMAFPPGAAARLEGSTRGVVLSGYGAMDFGGWAVPSPTEPPEIRFHTVGPARGGTELRLIDDAGGEVKAGEIGEIWGRGPSCASGYFRDEVATREAWTADGWFRTGDLGRFDSAGNLVIVGRKRDIIRRGGQTIQPGELEALLSAHPKIYKAAVVGFPDPALGERACVFLVPKRGEIITLGDVTGYLRERRIASFKLPERLELVDDLPVRGDKIDRTALRKLIEERVLAAAQRSAEVKPR